MRELEEEWTFAEADDAHLLLDAIEAAEDEAREKAEAERRLRGPGR
jgi:hypothetical protein